MTRLFPVRPRNWLSFNLRALLFVVTLIAIACGVFAGYYLPFQRQRAAIAAFEGRYQYAVQRPAGPAWLRRWFGEKNFQDVVELHLENHNITDVDLQHVGQLPHLEKLYLAHNPKITDKGLAHLRGLPKLRRMSLYNTAVTGAGFEHLATCPSLAEIDANTIALTQEMLTHLAKMPQLTWLAIQPVIEEPILLRIAELPHNGCLEYRYGLYCQHLTDAAIPALKKIRAPGGAGLHDCNFSRAGWEEFAPPLGCTYLHVSDTPIPPQIALKFLDGPLETLQCDSASLDLDSLIDVLPDVPVSVAWIHRDALFLTRTANLQYNGAQSPEQINKLCRHLHARTLAIDTTVMGDSLGDVSGVRELQVNCVADAALFRGIGRLKELRLLNITALAVADSTPLGELRELETLVLTRNFPAEKLRFLNHLTKLKRLKLSGFEMDDEAMQAIGLMKELRNLRIDFAGPGVNDETISALSGCEKLEMLSCAGAPITDDSIPVLLKLPKLRFVNLNHTNLTAQGREEIERVLNQRFADRGLFPDDVLVPE